MLSHRRKAAILDYWRTVELFSSRPVPAVRRRQKNGITCGPVFAADAETPLPWAAGSPHSLFAWPEQRFHVYCGIDQRNEVARLLASRLSEVFPPPSPAGKGRAAECCLFSFSADADGLPLFDTFRLSASAWMAGRGHPAEPDRQDWLSAFKTTSATQARDFSRRLSAYDGARRPLDYADLLVETRCIASELGLPELAEKIVIRIEQCAGHCPDRRRGVDGNNDASDELGKIAHELRNREAGRGLRDYLASEGEAGSAERIDVLATPLPLFQHLAPPLFPPARWPADAVLRGGPQFVVNTALKTLLRGAGLLAVDGPPGGERTAVLRDIVAAVVVERANRLAQLLRPEQAFIGERRWETRGGTRQVSAWREDLRGFEMVVASGDMAAVRGIASAFSDAALGGVLPLPPKPEPGPPAEQPAWAPLAARIDDERGEWHFRATAEGDATLSAANLCAALRALGETPTDWNAAVEHFRHAVGEELRLRQMRSRELEDFVALGNKCQEIDAQEARLATLAARQSAARRDLDTALAARDIAAGDLAIAESRRKLHRKQRPRLSAVLLSLGDALRQWRAGDRTHALCLEHAAQRLAEAGLRAERERQALTAIEREHAQAAATLGEQHRTASALKAAQTSAQLAIGGFYPSPAHWIDAAEAINRPAPWSDPLWNAARADVFTAALRLHQAFIAANAARLSDNFALVQEALAAKAADGAPLEALEAAWSSLFFVMPVVCVELSAISRIFSGLRRESLGWLLLDEAGQVPAQAAVGAIWRARRSVLFGDDAQPAPAAALIRPARQALRQHYLMDSSWLDDDSSAQQLAARSNRLGTWLTSCNAPRWTGVPLGKQPEDARPETAAEIRAPAT